MSKQAFAALRGVSPSAVSHWIKSGKLSAESLQGQGRSAKIKVQTAIAELDGNLDPGQQLARGGIAAPAAPAVLMAPAASPKDLLDEPVEDPGPTEPSQANDHKARYNAAKAERAEHENELARRKLAETDGQYLLRGAARAVWARTLGELWRAIETWLPDLATNLATELGVDRGLLLAALRKDLRAFRAKQSNRAAKAAAEQPDRVAEEGDDESAEAA